MTVQERLDALGIVLPEVPAPVAAYAPAVRVGDLVHTSGQLPFVDGALPVTGKVGEGPGLVDPAQAAAAARVAVLNAVAAVRDAVGTLEGVRIVRLTGYVASDPSFTGQPGVLNGASLALQEIFDADAVHARSAVGVAVLPLDAPVEVELVAQVGPHD